MAPPWNQSPRNNNDDNRDWPLPCTGNAATDVIDVLRRHLDRPSNSSNSSNSKSKTANDPPSSPDPNGDHDLPPAGLMPRLQGGSGAALSGVPLEQSVLLKGLTPPRPTEKGGGAAADGDDGREEEEKEGEERGGQNKKKRVRRGDEDDEKEEVAVAHQLLAQVPEDDHRE